MSEREYEQDKVYLKHIVTGVIYPYEKLLEKHEDFEPHVPNPSDKPPEKATKKAAKDFVEGVLDPTE